MEPLDATQLLAQLRDIQLPPAPVEPSIWPLVIACVVIAIAAALFLHRIYSKNKSWAAAAINELKQIQINASPTAPLQTAELLKRIVITHDNNPDIKRLSGDSWLNYLNIFFTTQFFTTEPGQQFGDALYQPQHHNQPLTPKTYATLRKLIRRRKWQDD